MKKRRETELPPFWLLTFLLPNQIPNNNVSVAIVFFVVESENVLPIAVIENMRIYEEDDARLWIGYALDVRTLLKNRDLETFIGCAEFDVSHANMLLHPSHDRRRMCRFEV